MNYLCSFGLFGVTLGALPLIRRLVALASACAAALVGWITFLPLRFRIAPVVSCATPNFLPTLTTFAVSTPNKYLLDILYNNSQIHENKPN